jgi:hypothetical protein
MAEQKRKKLYDPNQVNQASSGAQQSVTDSSGTGAGSFLGDIKDRILNTPANIAQKGIVGSIGQGIKDAASLSTLAGKSYIEGGKQFVNDYVEGGKSVLFGRESAPTNTPSPVSAEAPLITTSELQREALGDGATKTGNITPIPQADIAASKPLFNGKDVTFSNGVGGSAQIKSDKGFTQDQVDSLNKTLEFNSLQSTKDRFARDAQNTADSLAKYGNPYADGGSNLQSFYEKRLKEEFNRPFLRRGVINDLQGALAGLNKDKTDRDQLAAGLVGSQTKAQQEATQQAFENQNKNIQIQQEATKNLFELKNTGASPIELFNRYKSDTGGGPVSLGALRNIIPPDELNTAIQDPGAFKKLLETYKIPREDAAYLSAEQRQTLGQ